MTDLTDPRNGDQQTQPTELQAAGKLKDLVTGGGDEATDRRTGAGAETP